MNLTLKNFENFEILNRKVKVECLVTHQKKKVYIVALARGQYHFLRF